MAKAEVTSIKEKMQMESKVDSVISVFFQNGGSRSGKVLAYEDDDLVLENVEAFYAKNPAGGISPNVMFTKTYIPYDEILFFSVMQ